MVAGTSVSACGLRETAIGVTSGYAYVGRNRILPDGP
jgi:hypothetical protein